MTPLADLQHPSPGAAAGCCPQLVSSSGGSGYRGRRPSVLALSLAGLMGHGDCLSILWNHFRLQQTLTPVLTSLSYHLKCSFNGGRTVKVAILNLALE